MFASLIDRVAGLLGSIRVATTREIRRHAARSFDYRALRFSWVESLFLGDPRTPVRIVVEVTTVVVISVALLGIAGSLRPDALRASAIEASIRGVGAKPWDALWQLLTVQATVAALTYPIVLSLVGVLVTRDRSPARLSAYIAYSGAYTAGISSFALVATVLTYVIGGQALPQTTHSHVFVVVAAWALANMVLTGFFLSQTIRFLRPEMRDRAVKRYALFELWPRHLQLVLSAYHLHRFLDNPVFRFKHDSSEAKAILNPMRLGGESSSVKVALSHPSIVEDVWTLPLGWVVSRWIKRASVVAQTANGIAGLGADVILSFPFAFGSEYEREISLARVSSHDTPAPALTALERAMLRVAIRLAPKPSHTADADVIALFTELISDAHEAIDAGMLELFRARIQAITSFHGTFLRANDADPGSYRTMNYAQVGETEWGFRTVSQRLTSAYRELSKKAINLLSSEAGYFEMSTWLASGIASAYSPGRCTALKKDLVDLYGLQGFLLGQWWQRQSVERSEPAVDGGLTLRGEFRISYLAALKDYISEIASLTFHLYRADDQDKDQWEYWQQRAEVSIAQLHQQASFMLQRVRAFDSDGTVWSSDTLQRWSSDQLSLESSRDWFWPQERTPDISIMEGSLKEAVETTVDDGVHYGRSPSGAELAVAALDRYWRDLVTTVITVLVQWALWARVETASFFSRAAKGLLIFEEAPNAGSRLRAEKPIERFEDLASTWVRLRLLEPAQGSTNSSRLEHFLGREARSREPDQLAHRIYDASTLGLFDLLPAQMLSLCALVREDSQIPGALQDTLIQISLGGKSLAERNKSRLEQALASLDGLDVEVARQIVGWLRQSECTSEEFIERQRRVRAIFQQLLTRLASTLREAVESAPIDATIVPRAAAAADQVIRRQAKKFPITLFQTIEFTREVPLAPALSFNATRLSFARTPLATPLFERDEDLAEQVNRVLSQRLKAMIATGLAPAEIVAPTEQEYLDQIRLALRDMRSKQLTPVILVEGRHRPPWIGRWFSDNADPTARGAEREVVTMRAAHDPEEALGRLDGAIAYVALPRCGYSIVVPAESLKGVRIGVDEGGGSASAEISESATGASLAISWGVDLSIEAGAVAIRYERQRPS